ncbi:MAG TPA: RagB/SusD family nutrient uptake outer membrane protein [Longimicrobiaceae bacterium]|nr:RagB/SusD family nutrient uptake outer membrane protein [Longimicrobiaceae bacterium]
MSRNPLRIARWVVVPAIAVGLLTQCKGFLDTQPFGSLNTATYYKTAKDYESATIGAYATLQDLTYSPCCSTILKSGLLPDDDTRGGGADADNDFAWTPGNGNLSYVWDVSYRGILRANLILQQLDQTDQLTDAEKARFGGEAKFVRAYFYFLLARYFGTPPLVTTVATSIADTRPPNSDPGQLWDLIESDLQDAVTGLHGLQLENGRANEWAARALLGKVALYRAEWGGGPKNSPDAMSGVLGSSSVDAELQKAIDNLQAIVESGNYALVPYQNNFDYTTENNQESLFEMQASWGTDINGWAATDENGGGASSGTGRQTITGACGFNGINAPGCGDWGYGQLIATPTLVAAFQKFDSMAVTIPGQTIEAAVVTRDPRAYFTFYSTGQQFGHSNSGSCAAIPVPYNTKWSCDNDKGAIVASDTAKWSVTGYTPAKYIRPFENYGGGMMLNQSVSQNNERLIRYSDVLLMLAEAKLLKNNDVAGAADLINQVRARARNTWDAAYGAGSADKDLYASFSKPSTPAEWGSLADISSSVSPDSMLTALMHERRVEFAFEEGHRYGDLVRWQRAGLIDIPGRISAAKAANTTFFGDPQADQNWSKTNLLRPIPGGVIDLDPNLQQNPGY